MASDTTTSALLAQVVAARRLGAEGRLRVAAELSEDARQISIEGVLRRTPSYSYEDARRQVLRRVWGEALASRVWPDTNRWVRDLLERIVPALQQAGVPFMVAGSFASTAHGLPRATQDLDIVIDPTGKSLDALLSVLTPEVYYVDVDVARDAFRNHGIFNVIDHATGWKIDFILRKDRSR